MYFGVYVGQRLNHGFSILRSSGRVKNEQNRERSVFGLDGEVSPREEIPSDWSVENLPSSKHTFMLNLFIKMMF